MEFIPNSSRTEPLGPMINETNDNLHVYRINGPWNFIPNSSRAKAQGPMTIEINDNLLVYRNNGPWNLFRVFLELKHKVQ